MPGKPKEAQKERIFLQFRKLLEQNTAAMDKRILTPWMKEVDAGNMKAIELAIKRHPRLRKEFKEETAEDVGGNLESSFLTTRKKYSIKCDSSAGIFIVS